MESLSNLIIHTLGWTMFHSIWQGAAIYCVLFGLFLCIPQMSAQRKHQFASLAQLIIFGLFLITFGKYFSWFGATETVNSSLTHASDDVQSWQFGSKQIQIQTIFQYAVPLYFLGLVVQITLFIRGYIGLQQLRKNGQASVPEAWVNMFQQVKAQLGISRKIDLLLSDKTMVPLAIGFFKPVIIFPIAYVNRMSIADVELLLCHELAHVKRNDYLSNMLKVLVETLLFFNPFVWLISRHIEFEREQACDAIVLNKTAKAQTYAKALLAAAILQQKPAPKLSMAATGNKKQLFNRIQCITQNRMETAFTKSRHQLAVIIMLLIMLLTSAWLKPQATETHLTQPTKLVNGIAATQELLKNSQIQQEKQPIARFFTDTLKQRLQMQQELVKPEDLQIKPFLKSKIAQAEKLACEAEKTTCETEAYVNSTDFKATIAKAEGSARIAEAYVNSPAFKAKMHNAEEQARIAEDFANSPAFKAKIQKAEEQARIAEDFVNSPTFKAKIQKAEEQARIAEDFVNSPAFKAKIHDAEARAEAALKTSGWVRNLDNLN